MLSRKSVGLLLIIVMLTSFAWAQEIYKAPKAKKVTIDGRLTEWEGVPALTLDKADFLVIANRAWEGPEDLSGKVYVMWDEDYLYFACDITDNAVIQEQEGATIFQGDCVEIYLRMDYQKDGTLNYYTLTDYQFGFTPGTDADAPDYNIWNNSTILTDILVESQKTATGYILEIAIPVWEMGLFLEEGWELGFDVAIDDVDNFGASDTEVQLCWSKTDTGWQDPTVFQLLILD